MISAQGRSAGRKIAVDEARNTGGTMIIHTILSQTPRFRAGVAAVIVKVQGVMTIIEEGKANIGVERSTARGGASIRRRLLVGTIQRSEADIAKNLRPPNDTIGVMTRIPISMTLPSRRYQNLGVHK